MKNLFIPLLALFAVAASAAPQHGVLCLTFDDYYGKNWLKADALFKKYDAHAKKVKKFNYDDLKFISDVER